VAALRGLDSPDAKDLIELLESQDGDIKEILQGRGFSYAVLKLLHQGKVSVQCKIFGKNYQTGELKSFILGAGESPSKVNIRRNRSLFKRVSKSTSNDSFLAFIGSLLKISS
jgi:hypothetical protein